jgi:hypothetical protein
MCVFVLIKEIAVSQEADVVYPMEEKWDVLIVLDACRYDYMEKVYRDYVQGKLSKKISPGTWTVDWASKVFPDFYDDCVYVSANPFIGYTTKFGFSTLSHFQAPKHFHKIIEVWKTGWDYDLETVLPEKVNRAAIDAFERYPDKKIIVHYLQPHYPYIGLRNVEVRKPGTMLLFNAARGTLVRTFGTEIGNRIASRFFPSCEEAVVKRVGVSGLRQAYETNLRIVMTNVSQLVDRLKGKVVITADHGELLGEDGKSGHPMKFEILPAQIEVPWLEVGCSGNANETEKVVEEPCHETLLEIDEGTVRSRLRAIGYE